MNSSPVALHKHYINNVHKVRNEHTGFMYDMRYISFICHIARFFCQVNMLKGCLSKDDDYI